MTTTVTRLRPASRSGPPLDFEALYRSARDDVHAYATTLLRDRSAAEEVTATAFERAYRRRGRYDAGRGTPRAWLFGIARNAALDELRRRSRQATLVADPIDPAAPAPGDQAGDAIDREVLRGALRGLHVRDREVIALRFHAGLETAEVADVLEVSPSYAGTLLHRAMTKLREALDA